MGGGDLNLKKSWHPSTLRNIERVWKAEQKHEAEKQKIEQLQKELAAERAREEIQTFAEDQGVVRKKEEKLDWMYQGPSAMMNRDDYLLGKKIDKTFENLQQVESGKAPEDENNDVGSSMFSSQNLSGTATVDLATKIREDPLFNIMKKEKEQKKDLLNNPVRMKQLQQLLQASLKEKRSKKSKKSKKNKHQDNDSDEEVYQKSKKSKKNKHQDNDSDEEVNQKRKKHKKHRSSDSDSEQETSRESKKLYKTKYQEHSPDHKSSKYNNQDDYRQYSSSASYERREPSHSSHHISSHSRSQSSSNYKDCDSYDRRSKSHNENSKSQQYYNRDSGRYEREHYVSKSSSNHSSRSNHQESSSSAPKKKLDEKERDRMLKEMQDNAKWREDQRKKNTARYKKEAELENSIQHIDSTDFMKPMLAQVAHKGSVESRVKQKIFTIQRSSAAMDKNFARRE